MPQSEPYSAWRIRVTGHHTHVWEYVDNGEWTPFDASAGPIRLSQGSTGYIFYDETWSNTVGVLPGAPQLTLEAQSSEPPETNPFGAGQKPSFPPVSQYSPNGNTTEAHHQWNIVGKESPSFPNGFPSSTGNQVWHFNVHTPSGTVDPEMVVVNPNDPPPKK